MGHGRSRQSGEVDPRSPSSQGKRPSSSSRGRRTSDGGMRFLQRGHAPYCPAGYRDRNVPGRNCGNDRGDGGHKAENDHSSGDDERRETNCPSVPGSRPDPFCLFPPNRPEYLGNDPGCDHPGLPPDFKTRPGSLRKGL